eukprot:7379704-Prymnesium_polylepis.1
MGLPPPSHAPTPLTFPRDGVGVTCTDGRAEATSGRPASRGTRSTRRTSLRRRCASRCPGAGRSRPMR